MIYWKTCPDCDGCGEDIPGEECRCMGGDHPGLIPLAEGAIIIEDAADVRGEMVDFLREMGLDIACFVAADGVLRRLKGRT